jgi:hypothetical protein
VCVCVWSGEGRGVFCVKLNECSAHHLTRASANSSGQLGIADAVQAETLQPVQLPAPVRDIACGHAHTVVLSTYAVCVCVCVRVRAYIHLYLRICAYVCAHVCKYSAPNTPSPAFLTPRQRGTLCCSGDAVPLAAAAPTFLSPPLFPY